MRVTFDYNGVEMCGADFPRDLRGWVAFSIAFAAATHCRDKQAALELLLHEADNIVEKVDAARTMAPRQVFVVLTETREGGQEMVSIHSSRGSALAEADEHTARHRRVADNYQIVDGANPYHSPAWVEAWPVVAEPAKGGDDG